MHEMDKRDAFVKRAFKVETVWRTITDYGVSFGHIKTCSAKKSIKSNKENVLTVIAQSR